MRIVSTSFSKNKLASFKDRSPVIDYGWHLEYHSSVSPSKAQTGRVQGIDVVLLDSRWTPFYKKGQSLGQQPVKEKTVI